MLGKLSVPGPPTIWITVGQGPTALAVDKGGDVWTVLLSSILSFLCLLLFGRRPDIDLYCLKGPLNPKSTNNQPAILKLNYTWLIYISAVIFEGHLPQCIRIKPVHP